MAIASPFGVHYRCRPPSATFNVCPSLVITICHSYVQCLSSVNRCLSMSIQFHPFDLFYPSRFGPQTSVRRHSSPLTRRNFQIVCTTYIWIWYRILKTICTYFSRSYIGFLKLIHTFTYSRISIYMYIFRINTYIYVFYINIYTYVILLIYKYTILSSSILSFSTGNYRNWKLFKVHFLNHL
jgi:hypothetical protein